MTSAGYSEGRCRTGQWRCGSADDAGRVPKLVIECVVEWAAVVVLGAPPIVRGCPLSRPKIGLRRTVKTWSIADRLSSGGAFYALIPAVRRPHGHPLELPPEPLHRPPAVIGEGQIHPRRRPQHIGLEPAGRPHASALQPLAEPPVIPVPIRSDSVGMR